MHYRISVLGGSSLRGDEGHAILSVLQQPRRFALLVYLALESRSGPVRRDRVLGVFWPEKSQDAARGSLNQAIHYLRRSLGPEAIRTHADWVEVDTGLVSCDAAELMTAWEEGHWADAADLYGGELLPGYFDNGPSAELEHWLDATRVVIRTAAAESAWKMAEARESAGDGTGAVVWARRACDWSAGDEAQVRRLMEMMGRLGDRAGVLETYGALRRSLEELDTTPSPATRELLASLRARWEEEDRRGEAETPAMAAVVPRPSRAVRGGSGPSPFGRLASAAVTATLMIVILSLWAVTTVPTSEAAPRITVVIEEMGVDAGDAALARVLRGGVVNQLQEMTALRVVTEAERKAVARERGFILQSDLLRMGQELRASLHLMDGESGTIVASTNLEQSTAELPLVLDGMARSVAQFVRREVGVALDQRRLLEADAPEAAITLVQLGRQDMALGASLRGQRSAEGALAAYQKADSMFAEAAGLAPRWDLPWIKRAETAYRMMWIEQATETKDREAERELVARGVRFVTEALARNSGQAESLELRALLLQWQGLLAQPDPSGRSADLLVRAEADARRATELDPHRARAWNVLGALLLHRGAWADAYWALGRAVAADTHLKNDPEIILRLFTAAWEQGNTEVARRWCGLLEERVGQVWPVMNCQMHLMVDAASPDLRELDGLRSQVEAWPHWPVIMHDFDALAAVLHARAGEEGRAREILAGLPTTSNSPEFSYLIAWVLSELGDRELARATLEDHVTISPATRAALLKSRRFHDLFVLR